MLEGFWEIGIGFRKVERWNISGIGELLVVSIIDTFEGVFCSVVFLGLIGLDLLSG